MKDFYSQQGVATRKFYQAKKKKKWVGYCRVTFFQGMAGFYQTNYLISADHMITG